MVVGLYLDGEQLGNHNIVCVAGRGTNLLVPRARALRAKTIALTTFLLRHGMHLFASAISQGKFD